MAFKPNALTFKEGIDRIHHVTKGQLRAGHIVTSRDPGMQAIIGALRVTNVPSGFTKFQLPVYFDGGPGAQFFISIGAPDTDVSSHAHDEGDGIRFIIGGSVHFDGKELTSGDWMFIPKGVPYAMKTGIHGAIICYCYQCCCA